ncbi:hypothetical protein M405DRAFT_833674 [Rhizopogon salebrosus TDB-379]|nr:hypothetical protein M405DRAFT_833674 [Rhizopogon salebrosus TDB-379]
MPVLCPPLPPSYLATPLSCSSGAGSRLFSMAGHKSNILPASTAPTYGCVVSLTMT